MRFEGKTVLVTGAASGIGLAIAKRFVAEGAAVVGTDIDAERLEQVAKELGPSFQPRTCDAGSVHDIKLLMESLEKLDVLVNNAGIGILQNPEQLDEADYDRQLNVLLKGPIFHVKYAAPLLRQSTNGSVVNIASASALLSLPGYTAYGAAKMAITKFTQDAVITVPGVRHNVVLPGLINTPILVAAYGEAGVGEIGKVAELCPVPRIGQPDDIAAAVLYLASDEASYVSGASLVVDGGLSRVHVMSVGR